MLGKAKNLLNDAAGRLGIEIRRIRPGADFHERVVSLEPKIPRRGRALLSYRIEPFLRGPDEAISNDHTNYWETHEMADALRELGLAVDVISYRNQTFVPESPYAVFIGARTNFERISKQLHKDCFKLAHLDTAHWVTNNTAAYQRLTDLKQRRGISLDNRKMVEPNWALEHADAGSVLGNEFTLASYRYAGKPLHRIPISAPTVYDWPERKDFDAVRNRFIWFGSDGFVHKGLDLVLEAFRDLPQHHLTVCGPLQQEQRFVDAYHRELFETPNIHTLGWVDVAGPAFADLIDSHLGLVYPTCSEGGGGSAITCMHAGMIPLLSREASVDIGENGFLLDSCSLDDIKKLVRHVSELPAQALESLSRGAWELARATHTRPIFADRLRQFLHRDVMPRVKLDAAS